MPDHFAPTGDAAFQVTSQALACVGMLFSPDARSRALQTTPGHPFFTANGPTTRDYFAAPRRILRGSTKNRRRTERSQSTNCRRSGVVSGCEAAAKLVDFRDSPQEFPPAQGVGPPADAGEL